MVVNIIGWYGTETMGDRAILDGILSVLNEIDRNSCVLLGSLFPFYSNRTLLEEENVFKTTAPNISIHIYNVKCTEERKDAIKKSEVLLIGGGPLMDLQELNILKSCFKVAKDFGIPRLIFGCGIGPLKNKTHIQTVKAILDMSTKISYRDKISKRMSEKLMGIGRTEVALGDPAVISIENYKRNSKKIENSEEYAVLNLREYPQSEYGASSCFGRDAYLELLLRMAESFGEVKLVPMHTFPVGGDDRYYLSTLVNGENLKSIHVMHSPMNLHEMYACYESAVACIGMRYHSVVMQTILNGNNAILNYTDNKSGKIMGFLAENDKNNFYQNRLIHLQEMNDKNEMLKIVDTLKYQNRFPYVFSNMKENYLKFLQNGLK